MTESESVALPLGDTPVWLLKYEYLLSYKEQGKTILICSHSAEDISVLCDTVHEMDKGYITQIEM